MKKILSLILSAILLTLPLISCAKEEKSTYFTRTLRNENGRFSLSLAKEDKEGTALSEDELKAIYEEAAAVLEDALNFLSNDDGGPLSAVNAPVGTVFDTDKALLSEIEAAFKLSSLTEGLYTPAAGALTSLLKEEKEPQKDSLDAAIAHSGTDKFEISEEKITKLDPDAKIDFAAYSEGYAIGKVCDFLAESPVAYGIVTYNGIAGVFGQKPEGDAFTIEIGDDNRGTFNITDGYVALASADFGITYDFNDGKIQTAVKNAAVYSPDPCTAAVMASVCYANGSNAFRFYGNPELIFEAVIINSNGTQTLTKNCKEGTIYTPATTAPDTETDK